jgi:hypothetical protein
LPRSLSSLLYHAARRALALREPEWTTDGEVLNVRRFALLVEEGTVEGVKYVERQRDGRRFDQLLGFLDQVTRARGFAYKDVIQPYVVAEWLAGGRARVLHLDRPVPDVAYAMQERGWLYPARWAGPDAQAPSGPDPKGPHQIGERAAGAEPSLVRDGDGATAGTAAGADPERCLVAGLLRARRALAAVPGPRVRYDELIQDEAPLWEALRSLYGDGVARPSYLDDGFARVREEVLRRRRTAHYRRLAALCDEIAAGGD